MVVDKKSIIKEFSSGFGMKYHIYDSSAVTDGENWFFSAKDADKKYLFIIGSRRNPGLLRLFEEFKVRTIGNMEIDSSDLIVGRAGLSYKNIKMLQNIFPHLRPGFCGLKPSFGTGDRLGVDTAAHINSFKKKEIFPYLCQQSVRELNKTERSWQDVMSNTVRGVFEAGYRGPFGADADHVKELADLDAAIKSGFTMFTIDPSDFISTLNKSFDKNKISKEYDSIPEKKEIEKSYLGKKVTINKKVLEFDSDSLKLTAASYFDAIKHIVNCYEFIKQNTKDNFDFEVSMDEIDSAISPLAHIFIVSELKRNRVNFHNIALRYPGIWEKAIDYRGDIGQFSRELKIHAGIAKRLGGYKLSLHSGSEKFSVYQIFSKETGGLFHIKTSGTSWLESLRVIAIKNPGLFKDIYGYAVKKYEEEKRLYQISTGLSSVPDIEKFKENNFGKILDLKECRQLLHVTYGAILTAKRYSSYIFSDRIYKVLFENEHFNYEYVTKNINRHLELLSI